MSMSAAAWSISGFGGVAIAGGVFVWHWNKRRNPDAWSRSPLCGLALALMQVGVMFLVASSVVHVLSAVEMGASR